MTEVPIDRQITPKLRVIIALGERPIALIVGQAKGLPWGDRLGFDLKPLAEWIAEQR
jgi:hypothetical protein